MSEERDDRPQIALEDVAPLVLELAAQPALSPLVSRFLELVRTWATPSAVVAAARDPRSDAGWRLLPTLCAGSVPVGAERSLAGLVAEAPDCLVRPTVLRPREEVPGVKARDNWIVPWSFEGESGLLMLRGVPRPYPANLGAALALLSAPLWPRLLGGPATRIEALVEEMRGLSLRLQAETGRQLERLHAASAAEPAPQGADEAGRLAALEQDLASAREETASAARLAEQLGERLNGREALEQTLRGERDEARAQLQQLEARVELLDSQLAEERRVAQQLAPRLTTLASERDALQAELQRLRAGGAPPSGEAAPDELRRAVEAAETRARAHEEALAAAQREMAAMRAFGEPKELTERLARVETALETATAERDRVRGEMDRLATDKGRIEELRRAGETAEAKARAAEEALAAAQAQVGNARALREKAEARAREMAESWEGALETLRVGLAAVRRAAFVPPGLRLSMEDAAARMGPAAERPAPWLQVAILDRDPVGLEALTEELEAAGLEVRIANYPEELGLLLRTPASRELAAVVCDVMAFRPDQNVAGLFRAWDKDRPGIGYFLSYNSDNSAELDRARRVPQSLTIAHLSRPLPKARLLEAMDVVAKRRAQG